MTFALTLASPEVGGRGVPRVVELESVDVQAEQDADAVVAQAHPEHRSRAAVVARRSGPGQWSDKNSGPLVRPLMSRRSRWVESERRQEQVLERCQASLIQSISGFPIEGPGRMTSGEKISQEAHSSDYLLCRDGRGGRRAGLCPRIGDRPRVDEVPATRAGCTCRRDHSAQIGCGAFQALRTVICVGFPADRGGQCRRVHHVGDRGR